MIPKECKINNFSKTDEALSWLIHSIYGLGIGCKYDEKVRKRAVLKRAVLKRAKQFTKK